MNIDVQICAYYSLHGQGQNMVDSAGRIYAKVCEECAGSVRHGTNDGSWVCGHCGSPWGYDDVEIFKGEVARRSRGGKPVPAPRLGEYEEALAALAHFGYHLNAMLRDAHWRWATQVLVGNALTSCNYEEIALHANHYGWPTGDDDPWTAVRCEFSAGKARKELRIRLRK